MEESVFSHRDLYWKMRIKQDQQEKNDYLDYHLIGSNNLGRASERARSTAPPETSGSSGNRESKDGENPPTHRNHDNNTHT